MKYKVTHDKFITNRMADVIRKEFGCENVTYYVYVLGIARDYKNYEKPFNNYIEETEPGHFIIHIRNASEITQFHIKHPGYKFEEIT